MMNVKLPHRRRFLPGRGHQTFAYRFRLRSRADGTVLQGDDADGAGLDRNVDRLGLQSEALAAQPQHRGRRHRQERPACTMAQ
jgi:hypothetical protein